MQYSCSGLAQKIVYLQFTIYPHQCSVFVHTVLVHAFSHALISLVDEHEYEYSSTALVQCG